MNLKEINYIRADSGEEGLEVFIKRNKKLSLKNIHIIIMDCNLLEMTGYEASDLIKKLIQNEFY